MRREIFNYFNIAAKLTKSKNDERNFLVGSVAIRRDGALVSSINSASEIPNRLLHAEYKLSKKCDVGSTVYVCRVRLLDGNFGMARPCHSCKKCLISKGISKVYYSIESQHSYGVMDLIRDTEYQVLRIK
jgi:tRNA(Arg) A34 adenosine deaminase TadA